MQDGLIDPLVCPAALPTTQAGTDKAVVSGSHAGRKTQGLQSQYE